MQQAIEGYFRDDLIVHIQVSIIHIFLQLGRSSLAMNGDIVHADVALKFFRRYKRSDCLFYACALNVKSSMCRERIKQLWYKYVSMYITTQQSYLSRINTRNTSFEAYFDSKRKSRSSINSSQ